jgi:hypothetical protein
MSQKIWFKSKSYGWGWVPVTWQGWLVIVGWILLYGAILIAIFHAETLIGTLLGIVALCAIMILLFYFTQKKGEKPSWR